MKNLFRLLALVILLGGLVLWLAAGAHRGWSKTSVPIKKVDEVTGIEGIEYEKKFLPGVDFLGAISLTSVVILSISFAFKTKPTPNQP